MAVLKHFSIKNSPLATLKYIVGETKEHKAAIVTGLKCSEDPESAYMEMAMCYEHFAGEKFHRVGNSTGKEHLKMHHYVISFKGWEVTPQEAHRIAEQWAKEIFGDNHQVLIATHADTKNIHVHLAANAFNMDGKRWLDNKKTLNLCKEKINKLCWLKNLSVIENPKWNANQNYAEWVARQNGTSWKKKLCDDIDRIVLMENVRSIDDLVVQLCECGYLVRQGKYLSVRPANLDKRKPVRTLKLGDGYGLEELKYRIENKDKEMSLDKVLTYTGIQREYALCLRQIQMILYRKPEENPKVTYNEVRRSAELLCYIHEHNIHSKEDFEKHVNKIAEKTDYQIMKEHFSQEIYEAFSNIADYQTRREFTKEYALKKFHSILNSEADQIPSVVIQVYNVAEYWGMDFYDDEIIEMLMSVAKFSNEEKLLTNDTWIKYYLNKYNNRGKEILKIKPLVDMTYDYLMKKYPDNNDYYIGEVLNICNTLKGLMLEMSEPDVSLGMQFSLAEDKEIDLILDEFSAVCNDNAGRIKGMIYSLNCIYGIRTPEFFITAASDAVDAGSNRSWDIFRFTAVFYCENTAAFFECIRHEDGLFYPESRFRKKYPVLVQYQDKIAKAIAFYRNRDASEKFRKHLENENPEFSYYNAMADKRKTLCERFGDSFAYLRERIHGQSISNTLTELLDCCEAVSPMIGVEQTSFNSPATAQEIAECEGRIGFTLPVQMKEFLQFSNGASLFDNSTTIWDTSRIGKYTLDGDDDENAETYLPIGDFIGDGTQFVLNKKTGDIAEWDHETGEVEEYGDFKDFLAMIMDFHCSDYMD